MKTRAESLAAAFLAVLASTIQDEAERYAIEHPKKAAQLNEPYRAAGDRIIDAALALID